MHNRNIWNMEQEITSAEDIQTFARKQLEDLVAYEDNNGAGEFAMDLLSYRGSERESDEEEDGGNISGLQFESTLVHEHREELSLTKPNYPIDLEGSQSIYLRNPYSSNKFGEATQILDNEHQDARFTLFLKEEGKSSAAPDLEASNA